ncbi:MAG TPA: hypothetical protein DCE14_04700 [Kosmotogaceae bacterium]|nr:hypothetical protein [Kosmotogaceae bacterium]
MSEESLDEFCPECNMQVSARVIYSGHGSPSQKDVLLDESDSRYETELYSVALCTRCESPFLLKQTYCEVPGEFVTLVSQELLYPKPSNLPIGNAPEPVIRAYRQAASCFRSSSFEASALMCRRSLEALCKHLSAKGDNLKTKLNSLAEQGVIY